MKSITVILAISSIALLGACRAPAVGVDPEASAQYRAAWLKQRQGDSAGYRAGLEQVASRFPATRAGARAREILHPEAGRSPFAGLGVFGTIGLGLMAFGVPAAVLAMPSQATPSLK